MKKVLSIIAIVTFAAIMAGCGSKNTPTGVVEKSMQCLIDKDYEGYVDLMITDGSSVSEEEKAKYDEMRQGLVGLVESKMGKTVDSKGGIKGFEVLSEELDEAGEKGTVKVKVTYGDDSEDEQNIKVRKTEQGQWLLDNGK